MCFCSGRLYTVEEDPEVEEDYDMGEKLRLAVYSGMNEDNLMRLDTMDFEEWISGSIQAGGADHTDVVYICFKTLELNGGVFVVRYDNNKLALDRTLRCVRIPTGLAVASADALYVCDLYDKTVW